MAVSYLDIVKRVEAVYPQAIGTTGGGTHDESLRQMLVPWFNDLILEIDEMQRWSYNFQTTTFTTVQGTATYAMPTGSVYIKNVYYIDSTGARVVITKYEESVLARVYGDPASTLNPQGVPIRWSLNNRSMILFPIPDNSSWEVGGNYTIYVESYKKTDPIVETTGTTTAASATLTVPSTAYLTGLGVANTAALTVRGAGPLGGGSVAADLVTTAATVAATGVTTTMGTTATTAVTSQQTFYNSQPWVVTWAPKVSEFGLLRQVASYLQDQQGYQMYEARYQNEVQKLREVEMDRGDTLDVWATAQPGQRDNQLKRSDSWSGWDYRGGGG